ncbi:MAG: hypothetical protein WCV84_06060 [Patescibacteria group bacterium]|jgi:hypothetical protein
MFQINTWVVVSGLVVLFLAFCAIVIALGVRKLRAINGRMKGGMPNSEHETARRKQLNLRKEREACVGLSAIAIGGWCLTALMGWGWCILTRTAQCVPRTAQDRWCDTHPVVTMPWVGHHGWVHWSEICSKITIWGGGSVLVLILAIYIGRLIAKDLRTKREEE